jgi:hypothetical protein
MMLGRATQRKQRLPVAVSRAAQGIRGLFLQASRLHKLLWLLGFLLLTAAITPYPTLELPFSFEDVESAVVADEDIRAEIPFKAENLESTRQARQAAADVVPPSYRVDLERVQSQMTLLDERIDALLTHMPHVADVVRQALRASDMRTPAAEVVRRAVDAYVADMAVSGLALPEGANAAQLTPWLLPDPATLPLREPAPLPEGTPAEAAQPVAGLTDPEGEAFQPAYAATLAAKSRQSLQYVLNYGIMGESELDGLPPEVREVSVIREETLEDQKVSEVLPVGKLLTPQEAVQLLRTHLALIVADIAAPQGELPVDAAALQQASFLVTRAGVAPTLVFDHVSTEAAREQARVAVMPMWKEYTIGETIIRAGDRWTRQARVDARAYLQELESGQRTLSRLFSAFFANLIFVGLALAALLRVRPLMGFKEGDIFRSLNVGLLLTCLALVVGRVILYFDPNGFVVPVAAAAILVAILANARLALIVSMLISLLVMVQYGYNWQVLVVQVTMAFAGVFSIFVVRRRSDMNSAAMKATMAGLLAMAAIILTTDAPWSEAALRRMVLVLLNGGICMVLVPGLLSPLERLFGVTTDIQLLEYSDLNNEVLSRMAIEVPATYSHSLMMGQMAEAASVAVGANGLMARVCAYYHDIGKLQRPEYFSENQTGANVHDDLTPRMSARAIAAHVSEGVEMARQFHLPKPIIDGIKEHHGTSLIGFFYQQAIEQQKHGDVVEEDFRYPGPKPQRPETAILMICDATESGVRSIKNPNEDRIREFVEKIINARAADGQFDECDLTLKDLGTIREVVTRQVVTNLHTRIAYPEQAVKASEPERAVAAVARERE